VTKKIVYSILGLVVIVVIWQHQLIWYGIGQGYGQMKIIYNARPLQEYLTDPAFPDSLKQKLILIQEIRRFAIDSLGINDSDNYTTVYDQKGKPVLWVVTACPPYELEAVEWHFPIIGKFSYKGFFDYEKAVKEENLLKKQGYDTEIDEVAGWSTLGFFKDPILTSMLERSEGQLANLIIHELTHGTLYVKNNVEYNENLASFVGDQGALQFLVYKYGKDSKEYRAYQYSKINRQKYSDHILHGADLLDSLYNHFPPRITSSAKDKLKYELIERIMQKTDTISFAGPERYTTQLKHSMEMDSLPNNTYFMGYIRYRAQQNQFEEEFKNKFDSDFKKYLTYLKQTYPSI
jgi:predicted aminopeptidase